ncbi:restriction endonuclease subunit S [Campylobacter iguaniorum]|uniref:restriction endonuclease subunit S n=1 Tax=Campylobacter iguaniorum TaxID=1244531 RepID=UPI0007C8EE3B|nr:restriction endonuclease subunit S [Campylobacter iguaniorum]
MFSVKSNPQLNKDSFEFVENGEYPYFTRTCLNNGINGYVNYLDEEHKIKGNGLAVGMLGMQFFYMEKDFYAGQFTKTCYPKFERFNQKIAHFFIAHLNKRQGNFQAVLVRDFEKTFNETKILLPVLPSLRTSEANDDFLENQNGQIAFEFMEKFIKELEAERIKELEAYLQVTGLKNYTLSVKEKEALNAFEAAQNERERVKRHAA